MSAGLSEFNIFTYPPRPEDRDRVVSKLAVLDAAKPRAAPGCRVDLANAVGAVTGWIRSKGTARRLENTSIVGLLTNDAFLVAAIDAGHIDADLMRSFRRFLLASSLAYSGWIDVYTPHRLSLNDLKEMTSLAGYDLLARLDRVLAGGSSRGGGSNRWQRAQASNEALFLVVFGTILGVSYSLQGTTKSAQAPAPSADAYEQRRLWAARKENLCRLLTQKLLDISARLGLHLSAAHEQAIVDMACHRWSYSDGFIWASPYTARLAAAAAAAHPSTANPWGASSSLQPGRPVALAATRSKSWPGREDNTGPRWIAMPCPDVLRGPLPVSKSEPDPRGPSSQTDEKLGEEITPPKAVEEVVEAKAEDIEHATATQPAETSINAGDMEKTAAAASYWQVDDVKAAPPPSRHNRRRVMMVVGPHAGMNVFAKMGPRESEESLVLLP